MILSAGMVGGQGPMVERTQKTRTDPAAPDEEGFIQDFVSAMEQMPYVRKVLIDHSEGHLQTWVVIDAEPWEAVFRHPVYETELECARRHPGIVAGARL